LYAIHINTYVSLCSSNDKASSATTLWVSLQAVERDNQAWHEKHVGQAEAKEEVDGAAAEDKASEKVPIDASQAVTSEAAEVVAEEEGGDKEEEAEEEGAPMVGNLEYVMFRVDRRSRASRGEKGGRAAPAVDWAALNDEAKESIVEIVNERREAIERIVHGMRWP
jgi:hypothetical protein